MHQEVLKNQALHLLSSLSVFKNDFHLSGGIGLPLQTGHRVSLDFDLFSDASIKLTLSDKAGAIYALEILQTGQPHSGSTERLKIIQF